MHNKACAFFESNFIRQLFAFLVQIHHYVFASVTINFVNAKQKGKGSYAYQ